MSTTRNLTQQQPQMSQVQNPFEDVAKRQSGVAALGAGLMAMDDSDSDDDEPPRAPPSPRSPPPIAAPRPGYVTQPIELARPEPVATPVGRTARPGELTRTPSTEPHPLRAPITPIQPVFARPKKADPAVQFSTPIMRGGFEDVLIPSRGAKGDDFWRRFSIIAHDDAAKKPGEKQSQWLSKTQGGYSRMSRFVWCTGLILLFCIVTGTAFGVYISHRNASPNSSAPRTVGGEAGKHDGGGDSAPSDTPAAASAHASGALTAGASSVHFVSATKTVARRALPTGVAAHHALRQRQSRIAHLD